MIPMNSFSMDEGCATSFYILDSHKMRLFPLKITP